MRVNERDLKELLSSPDAKKKIVVMASTDGWQLLCKMIESRAAMCDNSVTSFVRAEESRTVEQIVTDNNRLVTMAESLRFAPALVREVLSKTGREHGR